MQMRLAPVQWAAQAHQKPFISLAGARRTQAADVARLVSVDPIGRFERLPLFDRRTASHHLALPAEIAPIAAAPQTG